MFSILLRTNVPNTVRYYVMNDVLHCWHEHVKSSRHKSGTVHPAVGGRQVRGGLSLGGHAAARAEAPGPPPVRRNVTRTFEEKLLELPIRMNVWNARSRPFEPKTLAIRAS